ncbi:hypothetical protein F5Y15DRAFT_208557 [Xylariaceae sp. FL0016]|nr:hypothetical protein F5Y15DRAFT_208557 [Xylariaceae sp. FL0016]
MDTAVPNRGPQLLIVDFTFLFISIVIVITRCFVRIFMVKRFGVDDWTMLAATVFFILYTTCSINGIHYGTGRHRDDLDPADYAQAKQFWWFCYLTYSWSMIMSKMSIGLFLLRVAVKKMHIWIIYGALSITVITCLAFFFVTIFQCHPISFFWDDYTQNGKCLDGNIVVGLAYLYSICAIVTDFVFALLPAWIIWQLKMKARTKLALIPLMAMGCVASAAVIVRCAFLPKIADPDFLWATTDIAIWSTVEEGLAISAGSLATLRPLVKLIGYKLGMTTAPTNPNYGSYHQYGTGKRRGSQSAVDALNMNTFNQSRSRTQDDKTEAAYEVNIQGGAKGKQRERSVEGGISHGRTYEVKSEYLQPEDKREKELERKSRRVSIPIKIPQTSWKRLGSRDTDSIEILRSELSKEGVSGAPPPVHRSFFVTDSDGSR